MYMAINTNFMHSNSHFIPAIGLVVLGYVNALIISFVNDANDIQICSYNNTPLCIAIYVTH